MSPSEYQTKSFHKWLINFLNIWWSSNNWVWQQTELIFVMLSSRLHFGKAHYYSVQNLLSSWVLSKNIQIKISLTLRERMLRCWEQISISRISGSNTDDEVTKDCRKLHNREFHILYLHLVIFRVIKTRTMKWAGHAHMCAKCDTYKILVWKH